MPIGTPKLHLLAYDIANPKRLTQVHHTVREWGVPLQYSVFVVYANRLGLDSLTAQLNAIIHPTEDDIRIYPLPSRIEMIHYGRQVLPEGVELVGGRLSGDRIAGLAEAAEAR
jgi:CRISPR-associated protein Cas2